MNLLYLVLVGLLLAAPVPEPLKKSLNARRAMKTAGLRYKIVKNGEAPNARSAKHTRFLECQFSPDSYLVRNSGNEDGVMWLNEDGNLLLGLPLACAPKSDLATGTGDVWSYIKGNASAVVHTNMHAPFDIRGIGLKFIPASESFDEICADIASIFENAKIQIDSAGDLVTITSTRERIENDQKVRRQYRWIIDPSKQYALVGQESTRITPGRNTEVRGECNTEYQLIDGYWFPSKFTGWRFGNNDVVLRFDYELLQAEFDRPEHPKTLTPMMLEIPAGTVVGWPSTQEQKYWNGFDAVPQDKWVEFKNATGNTEFAEMLAARHAADEYKYPAWWYDDSGKMGIKDLETNPDAWEAYVRRWCLKNGANDKQRAAAKAILEDSRKEARTILSKRAPELDKIEKQLKDGKLDAKKADEARAEGQRLLAPIAEIFNRLKSRLEPLLLQKQISAKQPTSAPATSR